MKFKLILAVLFFTFLFTFSSCSRDENSPTKPSKSADLVLSHDTMRELIRAIYFGKSTIFNLNSLSAVTEVTNNFYDTCSSDRKQKLYLAIDTISERLIRHNETLINRWHSGILNNDLVLIDSCMSEITLKLVDEVIVGYQGHYEYLDSNGLYDTTHFSASYSVDNVLNNTKSKSYISSNYPEIASFNQNGELGIALAVPCCYAIVVVVSQAAIIYNAGVAVNTVAFAAALFYKIAVTKTKTKTKSWTSIAFDWDDVVAEVSTTF